MAPNVVAAELLLSLVFCLLVVIASHPPTATAGSAALLAYLAADGRRGVRRSHAAARSQDWWNRCVPAMHDEEFERTFRVSRTVFFIIVAAASQSGVFTSALAHMPQMAVSLQVAMALYKFVDCGGQEGVLLYSFVHLSNVQRGWGAHEATRRQRKSAWTRSPRASSSVCVFLFFILVLRLGRPISFFDLAQKFGVSIGAAHVAVTSRFLPWFVQHYMRPQIFDRWPTTPEMCADYAAGMAARSDYARPMKYCIGALDGTLIPIWVKDFLQKLYYCRKGFYALSFQVVCNAAGYIIWIGGARAGSTWDGNAIVGETLLTHLMPSLPAGFYVIGDGGYRGLRWLLTPFKRKQGELLPKKEERWNYYHSLVRGIIEKVFGILKAKFRWMLRGIPLADPDMYATYFVACAILNNMTIDDKKNLSFSAMRASETRENSLLATIDKVYADDNSIVSYLAANSKHRHTAANLEKYLAEHRVAANVQLAPGAASASAAAALVQAVDNDAYDDEDKKVDIDDDATGKALRLRVYESMRMAEWEPTRQEEVNRKERARRAASRSNKEDI